MTYQEFKERRIYQNGIILSMILIGESAKQLSDEFCMQHPQIPVSSLAKTRDKLVHHYRGVDLRTVYTIAREDVPVLLQEVLQLLK